MSSQHPFVSGVTSNKALRELVAEAKAEVMEEIEDARDDAREDGEEEEAVDAASVSLGVKEGGPQPPFGGRLGKDFFLPLGTKWLGVPNTLAQDEAEQMLVRSWFSNMQDLELSLVSQFSLLGIAHPRGSPVN